MIVSNTLLQLVICEKHYWHIKFGGSSQNPLFTALDHSRANNRNTVQAPANRQASIVNRCQNSTGWYSPPTADPYCQSTGTQIQMTFCQLYFFIRNQYSIVIRLYLLHFAHGSKLDA